MEEFKVLITTSGLGSRLGTLTDYTNKSLIRVGDKPALSYIIESYPTDTNFVISLGHFGNHVKEFIQLVYPDRKFSFVEIDKYKGQGASLGYSILKCKNFLQSPFIFHASDTIIKDFIPIPPKYNYVFGSYKEDSSQYRTLNLSNGKLVKINEKGEIGYDFSYVGVCGVYDYKLFFSELENLINSNHKDTSDVHVINNMLTHNEFIYKEIGYGNWFDVGNVTELNKTRKSLKNSIEVLDKKDESIFFFDDFVVKFFSDTITNINRVKRASILSGLVPEIIDYTNNFYKYKKVDGNLFSKSVDSNKFKKFLKWAKDNLWKHRSNENFKKDCEMFYLKKTYNRVDTYLKSFSDVNSINGLNVDDIYTILSKIDKEWISNGIATQYHGDFILDNILETEDGFCLIDWRQDFSGNLEVGDMYYDLAKLNHNLIINHDIVNKNLFDSNPNNCFILINSKLNECRDILHKFILDEGFDLKKVEILTAIIWINMSPLHEYPFNTFLFNFGKYYLYKQITNE